MVRYDVNLVFDDTVRWAAVQRLAASAHALIRKVEFIDEYRGQQVPKGKKSVTLRLELGSESATLTTPQIEEAAGAVVERLGSELGGILRS